MHNNVATRVPSRQARQAPFLGTHRLKFSADDQELIREAEQAHGYDPEQETEVSFGGLVVRLIAALITAAIRRS